MHIPECGFCTVQGRQLRCNYTKLLLVVSHRVLGSLRTFNSSFYCIVNECSLPFFLFCYLACQCLIWFMLYSTAPTCVLLWVSVWVRTCVRALEGECTYVCECAFLCAGVRTCACVRAHTYTHTHKYIIFT